MDLLPPTLLYACVSTWFVFSLRRAGVGYTWSVVGGILWLPIMCYRAYVNPTLTTFPRRYDEGQ